MDESSKRLTHLPTHLSPQQIYASPTSVVLHRLYNMLLRDELNEFAYDASTAGLSYSVSTRTTGLNVQVGHPPTRGPTHPPTHPPT